MCKLVFADLKEVYFIQINFYLKQLFFEILLKTISRIVVNLK